MQLTAKQQKGQELVNTLVSKAWDDAEFKDRLVKAPLAAIEEVTGKRINLSKGKKIVVNDFSHGDYNVMVIPPKPNVDDLDLTDEQLEQVSGGVTPTPFILFFAAVGAGYTLGEEIQE